MLCAGALENFVELIHCDLEFFRQLHVGWRQTSLLVGFHSRLDCLADMLVNIGWDKGPSSQLVEDGASDPDIGIGFEPGLVRRIVVSGCPDKAYGSCGD